MVMGPDINYNFNFNFTYSRVMGPGGRVVMGWAAEHDEYRSLHIRMSNYLNMYKNYLQAM